MKLFCIPYAGGKAEMFEDLAGCLGEDIRVIPLEYSGHGERAKESFYSGFDEMAEDIAGLIDEQLDGDSFSIFGYSMGSVVAYEIIRRGLLKKSPEQLFIASHEAPGEHWNSMEYCKLDDEAFAHMIVAFGGFERFDERLLKNKFFRRMIFDPIRADYNLIGSYVLKENRVLNIPVTMFYSCKDVSDENAKKWQKLFSAPIKFYEMGDNHFFIREHYADVARIIGDSLCSLN